MSPKPDLRRRFIESTFRVAGYGHTPNGDVGTGVGVDCACTGTYHVGGTPRNAIPGWTSRPDPSARMRITVRASFVVYGWTTPN